MASLNRAQLIGHLGRDPESREMSGGSSVCNISIATSRTWKNKETGQKTEETEWHRVSLFDGLAKIASEYLKKGSSVYIEGRLKTRKWQDKEGKDQYTTEIIADQMQMLGGRDRDDERQGKQSPSPKPSSQANLYEAAKSGRAQPLASTRFDDLDDCTVPF